MTATDELRRMLDERGVDYDIPRSCKIDSDTTWHIGEIYYDAFERTDGAIELTAEWAYELTPEQAIAATLGDAFTREECEASFVHGYSLGTLPVGSDPQWDENRQTVDEHMAELGWVRERTCIAEENIDASYGDCMYVCSECGADFDNEEFPKYCPQCGARVVE